MLKETKPNGKKKFISQLKFLDLSASLTSNVDNANAGFLNQLYVHI